MGFDLSLLSKIVGYFLQAGDFSTTSPNLPMRIAILGEANHANQGALNTDKTAVLTAKKAGELYGYGSPIYHIMRILRPVNGGGVSGIPTIVYAQAEAGSAHSKKLEITPTGVATGNGVHTLIIAGRKGIDAVFYDINIETGDTSGDITAKIEDAINNVLGAPVIASSTEYEATLETKWRGLTANALTVTVDTTGPGALGITYSVVSTQAGSGTPSIANALAQFGNEWNTIVINAYGTDDNTMAALEAFNGIPDPTTPTGRYAGILWKPFVALTGSTAEDPSSITNTRLNDVTIAICPAPLSAGWQFEAAANYAALLAPQVQNNPELDISGTSGLPDMPVPTDIGAMSDYPTRDAILKKGCSTVDLEGGRYVIKDFVTTYHPIGETVPAYRYVRNLLGIDYNSRFTYYLLEATNVVDHLIANDNDVVSAPKVVKPKMWKGVLNSMATDMVLRGLWVDAPFMEKSISVAISGVNPDRFQTAYNYKRSGYVRQTVTTATAGFNFGTLNT